MGCANGNGNLVPGSIETHIRAGEGCSASFLYQNSTTTGLRKNACRQRQIVRTRRSPCPRQAWYRPSLRAPNTNCVRGLFNGIQHGARGSEENEIGGAPTASMPSPAQRIAVAPDDVAIATHWRPLANGCDPPSGRRSIRASRLIHSKLLVVVVNIGPATSVRVQSRTELYPKTGHF